MEEEEERHNKQKRVRKTKIIAKQQCSVWLTQFEMYWLVIDPNWKRTLGRDYSNLI